MNPTRPTHLALLFAITLLGLSGCRTPVRTSSQPNTATTWIEPAQPPTHHTPLGRIAITTVFSPMPLRVHLPPTRGQAMRTTLRRYQTGGQLYSQSPEAVPQITDPIATGAAIGLFGGLQGVATGAGILTGTCDSLLTGARGIPAAAHASATQAILRVQSRHPVTTEVVDRLREQPLKADKGSALAWVNGPGESPDTLLELYDGKQHLTGDGTPDPLLRLELGYRCTLIRASDRRELQVFRVGYASQGRRLREWGANDAAPLTEELERALASITAQITTRLAAIDGNPPSVSTGPELAHLPTGEVPPNKP